MQKDIKLTAILKETARLTRQEDRNLWKQFRSAAFLRGLTVRQAMLESIALWIVSPGSPNKN